MLLLCLLMLYGVERMVKREAAAGRS
jgi:hypothetical protein